VLLGRLEIRSVKEERNVSEIINSLVTDYLDNTK
jgi:hypothetical protein